MTKNLTAESISEISYPIGSLVEVSMSDAKSRRRDTFARIENVYNHHILISVDDADPMYNISLNKVDIATGDVTVEVVK